MDIEFLQTKDITICGTEAIVNPANEELWISSKVGQDLIIRCGDTIELEAMAQKPAVMGSVVLTSVGTWDNGPKVIMHAVIYGGVNWFPQPHYVCNATYNALLSSYDNNIESIAMPVLGEENRKAKMEDFAKSMLKGVQKFIKDFPDNKISVLKFIVPDEETLNIFYQVFSS